MNPNEKKLHILCEGNSKEEVTKALVCLQNINSRGQIKDMESVKCPNSNNMTFALSATGGTGTGTAALNSTSVNVPTIASTSVDGPITAMIATNLQSQTYPYSSRVSFELENHAYYPEFNVKEKIVGVNNQNIHHIESSAVSK